MSPMQIAPLKFLLAEYQHRWISASVSEHVYKKIVEIRQIGPNKRETTKNNRST